MLVRKDTVRGGRINELSIQRFAKKGRKRRLEKVGRGASFLPFLGQIPWMEGAGGAWPTCNYYAAAPFNRAQDWTHKKFCPRRAAIGTVAGNVLISDKQRHFFPRPFRAPVSPPRCAGFCRPLDDLLPVIIACRSNGENIKLSANTDIPLPSKKILTHMLSSFKRYASQLRVSFLPVPPPPPCIRVNIRWKKRKRYPTSRDNY